MSKIQHVYLTLLTTVLVFSTLSCTRNMGDNAITVSFAPSINSLAGEKLETVFINIHIPGAATIVKKYDYEGQNIVKGSDLVFSVPNIPQVQGTLVQFLGVFKDDTGVMDFSYGDATITNSIANITANSVGSATAQGQISGRLLASTMKTGRMTAFYTPATNPAYPMSVEDTDIVNGWFNIFALDGGLTNALTYKLDDGTTVFDQVYLSGSNLYIGGVLQNPDTFRMKVSYPTTYRQNYVNGTPDGYKARPRTALYYGFFDGGTTPSTPQQVCYPEFNESIIGIYTDIALASYVKYKYTGGTANVDITTTGGTSSPNDDFYTGNATCSTTNSDHLFFFPQMAQQDIEKATMVLPPFKAVQPQVMGSEWLTTSTTPNGGNTDYTFTWAYLGGVTASEVTGADVIRYSSSMGGGDNTCDSLLAQGAVVIGSVTNTTTTKTVTVGSGSWNFGVCAFSTTSSGKRYYKNFLRSGCVGMCNPFHYGWSAGAATTVSSYEAFTSIGGHYQRVSSVAASSASYPYFTELSLPSNASYAAGDELMLTISGAGSNVQCGSYDAGYAGFARVVGIDSSDRVRINKGSFVDMISTTNLAGDPATGTFCTLQAVKVPHYTNLTIDASGQVYAASYSHSTGGGIIAMRVNGLLTHNGLISATGSGYKGGIYSASYSGASPRHDVLAGSYSGSMGGVGSSVGGGGAGAEQGSAGATLGGGTGGQNSFTFSYINSLFGGGGGAGSSTDGSYGGGNIFITARKLVTASGQIYANGGLASGTGGAGGGGAITLAVKNATGSGLILNANGGQASGTGGVGGGGSVRAYFCNNNGVTESGELLLTNSNIYTAIGTGSYNTSAAAGSTFANSFPSTAGGQNYYFCNQ